MRLIGYVRVSSDKQADSGASLEAQAEKITAMAVVKGFPLIEIITDAGESAKNLDRPGMARLLQMVDAKQVDGIIISKIDRLTRSVKDLGELLERLNAKGVALISVAESLDTVTAAGRLVINIMGAVSQWERQAIAERTSDALQQIKRSGCPAGTAPYGFQSQPRPEVDGKLLRMKLVPNQTEREMIRSVRIFHRDGQPLQFIADWLNAMGYKTRPSKQFPNGGSFGKMQVSRILRLAADLEVAA